MKCTHNNTKLSGSLSPEVKRLESEVGVSPPCRTEIKNTWSYTSTPTHVCVALCLIKHRGNLTLIRTPDISTSKSDLLFSMLTSCKRNGPNPRICVTFILNKILYVYHERLLALGNSSLC
jgi:hypothetical protein